jgi:hypothetical protein
MVRPSDFNKNVPLPTGLTVAAIRNALQYMERELADLADLYYEQANVFSAIVGIYGTKALDSTSVYEKRKHSMFAQTRFPDLKRRGSAEPPAPHDSLECKASKRPWAVQSHYNHAGWYIIWRYLVDPTCALECDRPVIVWRVDVVYLAQDDWKYEGSKAGEGGGGRTHTFGLKSPAAKLKNAAVYSRSDVVVRDSKAVPRNGD